MANSDVIYFVSILVSKKNEFHLFNCQCAHFLAKSRTLIKLLAKYLSSCFCVKSVLAAKLLSVTEPAIILRDLTLAVLKQH